MGLFIIVLLTMAPQQKQREQQQSMEFHSMPTNPSDPMLTHQKGCCGKLSRRGKCCVFCSICSVVFAAIAVPIIIFVVAPTVAQTILDGTDIALPNMTQGGCSSLHAYVINTAVIKVPAPLIGSATLHSYTQEVYTTVCGEGDDQEGGWHCGKNATEALVGTYVSPEMSLSQGTNTENFAVRLDLNSSTIVLNAIVLPTFAENHKVRLILKAKDVAISAMGFKFGGLHMHKEMTCSKGAILPSYDLPNSACYPEDLTHAPPDTAASMYELSCVAGDTGVSRSATAKTLSTPLTV